MPNYWRDGCFAAGPLLFPGKPVIFDGSCCWTVGLSWAHRPQGVLGARFADLAPGPLSLPGSPGIPTPELWALGAAEPFGFYVCAIAAEAEIANASTNVLAIHLIVSASSMSLPDEEDLKRRLSLS
jgi:hypothetical protein